MQMEDYMFVMEASSAFLLLLFIVTLLKICMGASHKLLIQLIVLLLASNIGVIVDCVINSIIVKHNK